MKKGILLLISCAFLSLATGCKLNASSGHGQADQKESSKSVKKKGKEQEKLLFGKDSEDIEELLIKYFSVDDEVTRFEQVGKSDYRWFGKTPEEAIEAAKKQKIYTDFVDCEGITIQLEIQGDYLFRKIWVDVAKAEKAKLIDSFCLARGDSDFISMKNSEEVAKRSPYHFEEVQKEKFDVFNQEVQLNCAPQERKFVKTLSGGTERTYVWTCVGDRITKQVRIDKIANIQREGWETTFELAYPNFEGIAGFSEQLEYYDGYVIDRVTVDYEQGNKKVLEKFLADDQGREAQEESCDSMFGSMKEKEKDMKLNGYQEV